MRTMRFDHGTDTQPPHRAKTSVGGDLASFRSHTPAEERWSIATRLAAAEVPILGSQPALPPGLRSLR